MRQAEFNNFALLRRHYANIAELGNVINKCRCSTFQRLKGERQFSGREKELILDDLIRHGIEVEKSPETYQKYFGGAT